MFIGYLNVETKGNAEQTPVYQGFVLFSIVYVKLLLAYIINGIVDE